MAKQTFTTGQVLTAAQLTSLQQTAMLGGAANAKTASYTLVAADAGDAITMSSASPTTITVNTGLFAAGDIVTIINLGAGVCTITAGTATVTTSGSLALAVNQGGVLRFTSASAAIFFQFATPASGDIEGITTGANSGLTGGVTSGTADLKLNFASKGQLAVGSGSGTTGFLSVGTNGHTIVADSAETLGVKWAAPAGGGKVLQVVQGTTTTYTTSTSSSFVDTNLSASITPSLATSKILVLVSQNGVSINSADVQAVMGMRLMRGATQLTLFIEDAIKLNSAAKVGGYSIAFNYLDSPNTTSATTYKTQFRITSGYDGRMQDYETNPDTTMSTITLMEIGA